MRICVKFFAIARERAGVNETTIELPAGADVSTAGSAIVLSYPQLAEIVQRAAMAVNQVYADRAALLRDGDELAIIPPVSGG